MAEQQYQLDANADIGHYRAQVKNLRNINFQQKQAYQRKIQELETRLKDAGMGRNPYSSPTYTSPGVVSAEIIRRDKEIDRLTQENTKLKRQLSTNPDRELFIRNKSMFDQLADREAQIAKLKRTIYQLESKYDGKYFNDTRTLKQYQVVLRQNQKLKKQLEAAFNATHVDNPSLLQGLQYKKQYDIVARENEYLRNQLGKLKEEQDRNSREMVSRVTVAGEVQVLRREASELRKENARLVQVVYDLQVQNEAFRDRLGRNKEIIVNQTFETSKVNNPERASLSASRKRPHIFNRRSNQVQQNPQPYSEPQPAPQSQPQPQSIQQKVQNSYKFYSQNPAPQQSQSTPRQPTQNREASLRQQSLTSQREPNLQQNQQQTPTRVTITASEQDQVATDRKSGYYDHLYLQPRR